MESLFAALGVVFLAELGDKTQLVALGFGARYPLAPVLTGVVAAYAATNLLSVLIGGVLGATLPSRAIGIGGGVLFLGFAVWNLREEDDDDDADGAGDGTTTSADFRSIALSVGLAMFVAELGDKTMLATATLAAQGNPVLTWVGATIGICLSGAVGVLVGRSVGARLPEHAIRIGSSVLFAIFGVVLIATNI